MAEECRFTVTNVNGGRGLAAGAQTGDIERDGVAGRCSRLGIRSGLRTAASSTLVTARGPNAPGSRAPSRAPAPEPQERPGSRSPGRPPGSPPGRVAPASVYRPLQGIGRQVNQFDRFGPASHQETDRLAEPSPLVREQLCDCRLRGRISRDAVDRVGRQTYYFAGGQHGDRRDLGPSQEPIDPVLILHRLQAVLLTNHAWLSPISTHASPPGASQAASSARIRSATSVPFGPTTRDPAGPRRTSAGNASHSPTTTSGRLETSKSISPRNSAGSAEEPVALEPFNPGSVRPGHGKGGFGTVRGNRRAPLGTCASRPAQPRLIRCRGRQSLVEQRPTSPPARTCTQFSAGISTRESTVISTGPNWTLPSRYSERIACSASLRPSVEMCRIRRDGTQTAQLVAWYVQIHRLWDFIGTLLVVGDF